MKTDKQCFTVCVSFWLSNVYTSTRAHANNVSVGSATVEVRPHTTIKKHTIIVVSI